MTRSRLFVGRLFSCGLSRRQQFDNPLCPSCGFRGVSTSRQASITKVQNNSAFVCYRHFVCAFIPLTLQIPRTCLFTWSAKRHILIVCTSRRGIYKNQTCSIGDAHSHRIRCSDVSITISILRESSAAASPDHRLKNHAPSPPFGVLTVRRSERPPPLVENGIVHLDNLFRLE